MAHEKRGLGSRRVDGACARALGWLLTVVLGFCSARGLAQMPPPVAPAGAGGAGDAAGEESPDAPAPDSPRASVARFTELCRAGRYDEAAEYLELPPELAQQGPKLARQLKAVLDRYAWVDLETISARPSGDEADGLPRNAEQIAELPGARDVPESVRMVRRRHGNGARWMFTAATVARIDAWYARLGDRWLQENLPPVLLRPGPRELLYWQWLALPLLVGFAWLGARLLCRLTLRAFSRAMSGAKLPWDHPTLLRVRVRGPLTLAWSVALGHLVLPWLNLYKPAESFLLSALRALLLLAFFWLASRSVDLLGHVLSGSAWSAQHPALRSMLQIGARLTKLVVFAIGIVAMLSQLGYPVGSLIAGLGIGGLAVALAAQKTLENLFGAFSIGADQPFREGDFIKVDNVSGTVEAIGLRSTRIRTLDRTVISMPNGKLAEMRLESFAHKDRQRFACSIGLVFGTSAAQVRQVLAGIERALREQAALWPQGVTVCFKAIRESDLELEVAAWFVATDAEFQVLRQELLLRFLEVVEEAGTAIAYPTRTLHVERESGGKPAAAL